MDPNRAQLEPHGAQLHPIQAPMGPKGPQIWHKWAPMVPNGAIKSPKIEKSINRILYKK